MRSAIDATNAPFFRIPNKLSIPPVTFVAKFLPIPNNLLPTKLPSPRYLLKDLPN